MKTVCSCGFDCSTFITSHTIPAGGRFDCPQCEEGVQAAEETLDASRETVANMRGQVNGELAPVV